MGRQIGLNQRVFTRLKSRSGTAFQVLHQLSEFTRNSVSSNSPSLSSEEVSEEEEPSVLEVVSEEEEDVDK
jgi:hypothetical protein